MLLGLNMSLLVIHTHIPVGNKLTLFAYNWHSQMRDPWVL